MSTVFLKRSFFVEKEFTVYSDENFEASIFRFDSGIEGIRIKNSLGYIVLLPYHGQMIWDAVFYNKSLKMQNSFSIPKPANEFLNTYGCYLMHCGPRRICLDKNENHPLHGDLPLAPYDSAALVIGSDETGQYISLTGDYEYNRMFGDHYLAQPSCRLYADSSVLKVSMLITNLSNNPLDYMYLFHINNPAREGAHFVQPLRWTSDDMTLLYPPKDIDMPEESAQQRELIINNYQLSSSLVDGVQYAPEFSIELRNPIADENNIYNFMQVHHDGGSDYTGVPCGGSIRCFSRWITRTNDHSACSICSPASCGGGGYTAEKEAGRVMVLQPGEAKVAEVFVGYLNPKQASEMEHKILKCVEEFYKDK